MQDPKVQTTKPSNPKDVLGTKKVPMSTIPAPVLMEVGLGMLEGHLKGYGRHNYRVIGVRGSVYYDGVMRHMMAWWEGQDLDPDSKLSHISKAISSLVVLRDAMMRGNWVDDRPPACGENWIDELNKKAAAMVEKYPSPPQPYTQTSHPANAPGTNRGAPGAATDYFENLHNPKR